MNFRKQNIPSFSEKDMLIGKGLRRFFSSHVFIGTNSTISSVDLEHLRGKTLIIDFLNPLLEKKLISYGVKNIISCLPPLKNFPFSSFSLYEALLQLTKNKTIFFSGPQVTECFTADQVLVLFNPLSAL